MYRILGVSTREWTRIFEFARTSAPANSILVCLKKYLSGINIVGNISIIIGGNILVTNISLLVVIYLYW